MELIPQSMQQWTWVSRAYINFKNAHVFSKNPSMFTYISSLLSDSYRMPTINEGSVSAFTWTEFLTDNDALHEFYHYHYDNGVLRESIIYDNEEDDLRDRSELLNWLAVVKRDKHFSLGHIIRMTLDDMYKETSVPELLELIHVPKTLNASIKAAQSRQYMFPHNLTGAELTWQDCTGKVCALVETHMNDMISIKSGFKPVLRAPAKVGPLVPYYNDAERQKWHRTDDCGGWMHDDGRTWEEMENNGMLPYDEAGDTEPDDDTPTAEQYVAHPPIAKFNQLKIVDKDWLNNTQKNTVSECNDIYWRKYQEAKATGLFFRYNFRDQTWKQVESEKAGD